MHVVISGISSPLAIATAKKLLAEGCTVLGFCRDPSSVKRLFVGRDATLQLAYGDLREESALEPLLHGADAVVHIAGLSSPWGRASDFFAVNANGTRHMLRAATKVGVQRFVHISSPSVLFSYQEQLLLDERAPLPRRPVNAYAASKRRAEELVTEAFLSGLPTVILRPRALFGPGDRVLLPRLLKACQRQWLPRFFKGGVLTDLTYIENAADAILCALRAPREALGEIYHITNGEPVEIYETLRSLLHALGREVPERPIPYLVGMGAALGAEGIALITGREPTVTRYGVGLLRYSQTLSIEKARRLLGYLPTISMQEGLSRYVSWWHAHHSL